MADGKRPRTPRKSGRPKVASKAKRDEFLQLVAVLLPAAFQRSLQDAGPFASKRDDRLPLLAGLLHEAREVAAYIPERLSALEAANDFLRYATDDGPHWYEPPKRPIPAPWMGLVENADVQSVFSGIQEEIDGRFQSEHPRLAGAAL